MKVIFFISLILSLLHLYTQFSTSDEIFESIQQYTKSGKMVNNESYFIYDENNYTGLDIHGEKMNSIYSLQNKTYWKNNKLSNYIFLVKSITGDAGTIVKSLTLKIKKNYTLHSNNYFAILIVTDTEKDFCYSDIEKLSDSDIKTIQKNMESFLYKYEYFQAIESVFNDIDLYLNKKDNSKKEDSSLTWLWILLGVIGGIILIIMIVCIVKCCSRTRSPGYVKGIDNNYNSNKSINDYDYYGDNNCSHNVHIINHHSDINVNIHSDNHHNDYIHEHHIDIGRDNDVDHGHTVEASNGDHGHVVESSWGDHGHVVESSWGDHGHVVESSWGDHGHVVESDWGGHDSGGHDGGDDGGYDGGGDCGGDCGGDGAD